MSSTIKDLRIALDTVGKIAAGPGGHHATALVDSAYDRLVASLYEWNAHHWRQVNKKPESHPVPFVNGGQVLDLPVDADGYAIPVMPELEASKWYEHDFERFDGPQTPAAFLDPETMVEWFSRDNGLEDMPIAIKDIDWSQCRKYRKYEPIDETIEGFGMF